MDTGIFRKAALDRLSSPEQLDLVMRVTRPRSWLALGALFLVLAVVVVWGYTGKIPTIVSGQGVIVRTGTVLNVVTLGSGMVTEISVKPGDLVRANELVARVSQPEMLEKIRLTQQELDAARAKFRTDLGENQQKSQLNTQALEREKSNAQHEIEVLHERSKIAQEQIDVDQELLTKGLITRLQSLNDQQKLITLKGQIATLEAQIKQLDAQEYVAKVAPTEAVSGQQEKIADIQRTLAQLQQQLDLSSRVISPYSGQVTELKSVPGAQVGAGAPILSLQPEKAALEVVIYVPADKAKAILPGMEAEVSPSVVKREEYGFMIGKVDYVGAFPSSTEALMRNFENETLVRSITASGPVTEVGVQLAKDPATLSGYKWSSPKGPPLRLSSGTISTAQIVTLEQRPVSLLFPILKKKLGLS
jgi:HlyD family secretion protein